MAKIKTIHIEAAMIILIFAVFLWYGLAANWNYQINHDFAPNFRAADAFWNNVFADNLQERGSFDLYAPYFSGGYDDVAAYHPPLVYHLAAIFSDLSGIKIYDSIYFVLMLMMVFLVLAAYILARRFNKNVALLSLPIPFLIFISPFETALSWGIWSFLIGSFFVIPTLFSLSMIRIDKAWILLGIFLTGIMLTNFPQFGIIGAFIFLYLAAIFIFKKEELAPTLKKLIFSGIIVLIASLYWLIIFKSTLGSNAGEYFVTGPATREFAGFAVVLFSDFGFLMWLIIAGLLASLLFVFKKNSFPVYSFIFLFLMGFGNYFGFGKRSLQMRFLWPIYASMFIGILIYIIAKTAIKEYKMLYSAGICLVLLALMIGLFYKGPSAGGLADPYHAEAFGWIIKNTDEDARLLFFYGDSFGQKSNLASSKRLSYLIDINDFVESLKVGSKEPKSELIDEGSSGFAYRISMFTFGHHATEDAETNEIIGSKKRDICGFYDYFIFDKLSSYQPQAVAVNLAARDVLLGRGAKEVFSNSMVSILKNTKEADCIG